jgi:hypothetical protein
MNIEQKNKSLVFGIPGLILQIGCLTLSHIIISRNGGQSVWITLLTAGSLIGVLLLIAGLRHYAKAKGYGSEWGLLGIFSLLGVLVLIALPDKINQ